MNIQLRPPYFKCCSTEAAKVVDISTTLEAAIKTTSFGHVTPHLLYLPPCAGQFRIKIMTAGDVLRCNFIVAADKRRVF
jgi:hypothetical protein